MAITGLHAILYSTQDDATRAFFRDVLGFPSVDAGRGWLIFKAPPAEIAVHPADGDSRHELYLMCDDIEATIAELNAKGVKTAPISELALGPVERRHAAERRAARALRAEASDRYRSALTPTISARVPAPAIHRKEPPLAGEVSTERRQVAWIGQGVTIEGKHHQHPGHPHRRARPGLDRGRPARAGARRRRRGEGQPERPVRPHRRHAGRRRHRRRARPGAVDGRAARRRRRAAADHPGRRHRSRQGRRRRHPSEVIADGRARRPADDRARRAGRRRGRFDRADAARRLAAAHRWCSCCSSAAGCYSPFLALALANLRAAALAAAPARGAARRHDRRRCPLSRALQPARRPRRDDGRASCISSCRPKRGC